MGSYKGFTYTVKASALGFAAFIDGERMTEWCLSGLEAGAALRESIDDIEVAS